MEKDSKLYWKHYRVWIYGVSVSFPISGLLVYVLNDKNPDWVVPVAIAILAFPLIPFGAYGLRHGYCGTWRYGWIYRGSLAVYLNSVPLILYVGIVAGVILIGGRNLV